MKDQDVHVATAVQGQAEVMTIYLYFPKLKGTAGFAPGQLSTIAEMYYCKGRFAERTYTRKERSYTYYFKLTHDPIAKKIIEEE